MMQERGEYRCCDGSQPCTRSTEHGANQHAEDRARRTGLTQSVQQSGPYVWTVSKSEK
jgi:hypothetical protein